MTNINWITLDKNFYSTLIIWAKFESTQQTFVLMKTSSRCLDQDEYVRLSLTSSEDVFKTSWSRPIYSSWLYVLREVLKMSSRRLGRRKIVTLKTCWRRFQDMSWRPTNVCWVETEGKINLLVTFIQSVVTQSKLSLIFTKTLYLHIKQPIFRVTYMTHSRMQMSQSFIYLS